MERIAGILAAAADQWHLILAIAALAAYRFLASRVTRLPSLPLGLLILYFLMRLTLSVIPGDADAEILRALGVAEAALLYCAAARIALYLFVESVYRWRAGVKLPKITRDLILAAAYAVIAFVVLRTRGGVNLVGLITTSAVLTAVIGLAAQNILGNLFAGLGIQIEHPFRIGDWIQYHDYTGRVTGIGWEATRLKTLDDEAIVIPNLDISKSVIKNYSMPTTRHAMKIEVGVEYGAAPNRVAEVLLGVCGREATVLDEPPPVVRVLAYGDFAITYQVRFFYEGYGNYPEVRTAVMKAIWYALRRAGIRIPFPIRDVQQRHIERRFEAEELSRLRAAAISDLSVIPILTPLSPEAREELAGAMAIEEYGDGETIVRQGDAGDSLYIIHRGACDVEVEKGAGQAVKVADLLPPAFFGEMSLLTGEPRSATVRARGDTTVFSIGKAAFREILVAEPEISGKLAEALAARQVETAQAGRGGDEERRAGSILARIKSFFSIAS